MNKNELTKTEKFAQAWLDGYQEAAKDGESLKEGEK